MNIIYTNSIAAVDWAELVDDLTADNFHNGRTVDEMQRSFENSAVVILAMEEGGRIIGTVRALSDGVCNAYVVDVWTRTDYRRQGIASHMMALLEHELPGQHVYLFTDDMVPFYESLGYQPQEIGMGKVIGRWLNH
jgi:ribosomal protein S18 acetylase RimI-like enzyme